MRLLPVKDVLVPIGTFLAKVSAISSCAERLRYAWTSISQIETMLLVRAVPRSPFLAIPQIYLPRWRIVLANGQKNKECKALDRNCVLISDSGRACHRKLPNLELSRCFSSHL